MYHLSQTTLTLWASVVQAIAAIVSVALSLAALSIARSSQRTAEISLSLTKQVAEREREDWKQRKWFDLYIATNAVYDLLDRFQNFYGSATGPNYGSIQCDEDWNRLMAAVREVHVAALVFPKNPAIDNLIEATAHFERRERDAFDKERLPKLLNALEGLRQKALVNLDILS